MIQRAWAARQARRALTRLQAASRARRAARDAGVGADGVGPAPAPAPATHNLPFIEV